MVGKLVSSNRIISKVLADLDIKEDEIRVSDVREWIGEAIEKIGSVNQLVRKVTGVDDTHPVKIVNNQAKIPDDAVRINQVAYSYTKNGPWYPMRVSSGSFNTFEKGGNRGSRMVLDSDLVKVAQLLYAKYPDDALYENIGKLPYDAALELINNNPNIKDVLTHLIGMSSSNQGSIRSSEILTYSMKPGFINTSPNRGYLKISYDAFPTDDKGYPLIPDLASYSEAIFFYVAMKLKYPEYLSGRMNINTYYDIRRSWNFYRKQAYAESIMPTADDMETIKNVWNRLIPNTSGNMHGYSDAGIAEHLYNQTR